jgi:hypothetical protein
MRRTIGSIVMRKVKSIKSITVKDNQKNETKI